MVCCLSLILRVVVFLLRVVITIFENKTVKCLRRVEKQKCSKKGRFLFEVVFRFAILGKFVVGSKDRKNIVRIAELISQSLQL